MILRGSLTARICVSRLRNLGNIVYVHQPSPVGEARLRRDHWLGAGRAVLIKCRRLMCRALQQ